MGNRIEINIGKQPDEEKTQELVSKRETQAEFFSMDKIELSKKDILAGVSQLEPSRLKEKLVTGENGEEVISAATLTKAGKEISEDQFLTYYNSEMGVFGGGVFDGVGGQAAGEVASGKANEHFHKMIRELSSGMNLDDLEKAVDKALGDAIKELDEGSETNKRLAEADTTFTVGIGFAGQDGNTMYIFNAGDSRAYYFEAATGRFVQITEDDSFVNILQKTEGLSSLQTKVHPDKNVITKALRNTGYRVYSLENLKPGDRVCFFSDGVTDQFREDSEEGERSNELQTFVRDYDLSPTEFMSAAALRAKQRLSRDVGMSSEAKEYLSKSDDATAVTIRIPGLEGKEISDNLKRALLNDQALLDILNFYVNEEQGVSGRTKDSINEDTIENDIRKFRKEFATEDDFIDKKAREEFFENFEKGDRQKYERRMSVFQDLMFKS